MSLGRPSRRLLEHLRRRLAQERWLRVGRESFTVRGQGANALRTEVSQLRGQLRALRLGSSQNQIINSENPKAQPCPAKRGNSS